MTTLTASEIADPTPAGYAAIVQGLLDSGYALADFDTVNPAERHLVLRHDVDQSLAAAQEIAEVEAARGWRSCFFVLVRTGMYNVAGLEGSTILNRILDLGHQIGLHLDATFYGDSLAELEKGAEWECRLLENLLQREVSLISFHRPQKALLGLDRNIVGRNHTYRPRYFSEMEYCSDSTGCWRFGTPCDKADQSNKPAMQLLTHPVWWTGNPEVSRRDRLVDLVSERGEAMEKELRANCRTF